MSWQKTTALIANTFTKVFAAPVRYTPVETGVAYLTCAIFDPTHLRDPLFGGGQGTDSYVPVFAIQRASLQTAPQVDDRITLASPACADARLSRTFIVKEVEEDGWAAYRLHCFEAI